jgi:hypothetical protein
VYHTRVPHAIEERQIRDGVGVEEARGEIDPVLGGEPLGPVDLAAPVAHRLDHIAGEAPVAHDQLRDQVMLDPEIGAERLRQVARGTGQEGEHVAGLAMRRHLGRHPREHVRPDGLAVPADAVRHHGGLVLAAYEGHRDLERAADVEQAQLVPEEIVQRAREIPAPGLPRAPEMVHVERSRVPREQRPVDVEESGDGHGRSRYARSITMAMPCPPPMQSEATPSRASRSAMA